MESPNRVRVSRMIKEDDDRLGLSRDAAWHPPVIALSSLNGEGFDQLVAALDKHQAFLDGGEPGRARNRRIAEFRMLKVAEELLRLRFRQSSAGRVAALAGRLAAREISPHAAGEQLLAGAGAAP